MPTHDVSPPPGSVPAWTQAMDVKNVMAIAARSIISFSSACSQVLRDETCQSGNAQSLGDEQNGGMILICAVEVDERIYPRRQPNLYQRCCGSVSDPSHSASRGGNGQRMRSGGAPADFETVPIEFARIPQIQSAGIWAFLLRRYIGMPHQMSKLR